MVQYTTKIGPKLFTVYEMTILWKRSCMEKIHYGKILWNVIQKTLGIPVLINVVQKAVAPYNSNSLKFR